RSISISRHCSWCDLVLDGGIGDGEFATGRNYVAIPVKFEIRSGARENNHRRGDECDPAQERAEQSAVSVSARKRNHAGVETKRHLGRRVFFGLRRRAQQTIKI